MISDFFWSVVMVRSSGNAFRFRAWLFVYHFRIFGWIVGNAAVDDLNDDGYGRYYSARYSNEVEQAIERRTKVHADELLAEDQRGRRILQLREERDNLLDSVWLATSPKQIKLFWEKVAELLGDKQTQLERDALAIEPVNYD
jgi:hypothetical protein